MNLSGLKAYGSFQYRAVQSYVNGLTRLVDEVSLTIVMEPTDADVDLGPSGNWE